MVIENFDPIAMEWLGDRVTNFIDNSLDVVSFAGAGALGFFKMN